MNIGTRIKDMFKGMWEDTRAVSPIVATLVLVVVAITGAAAVGTIMGTFSSDVADESNTGELVSASSTEILIAGSTTVQPVSELLAEAYMDEHQGVKITVQGGGSGAGVSSVGMDIVDIGAASRDVYSNELAKFPDIKTHKIGGSAVVVIVNDGVTAVELNVDHAQLKDAYENNNFGGITNVTVTTLFQRAEESGTEDTFKSWLDKIDINDSIAGATGNAGVLELVQTTPDSMGFVDFGFADGADGIEIIGIYDKDGFYGNETITSKNLKKELSGADDRYPDKLARPLNYMTNGEPNSMEQAFITFARSPGAATYFEECGFFPVTSIA